MPIKPRQLRASTEDYPQIHLLVDSPLQARRHPTSEGASA
jgi:hypothetical protein